PVRASAREPQFLPTSRTPTECGPLVGLLREICIDGAAAGRPDPQCRAPRRGVVISPAPLTEFMPLYY
ncbi:MAG: hypothetical protein LC647_07955, partial [Beggiatoa sp.]|nr:hypothetical protein [Beggiatoa sp.]